MRSLRVPICLVVFIGLVAISGFVAAAVPIGEHSVNTTVSLGVSPDLNGTAHVASAVPIGELGVNTTVSRGVSDMNRTAATPDQNATPVLSIEKIQEMNLVIQEVYVDDAILRYIRDIVVASRNHGDIRLGTSTRGSLALLRGARAYAAMAGRTYVIPDDVKRMARPVLGHRLVLEREAEIGRISVDDVVGEILETVEVA